METTALCIDFGAAYTKVGFRGSLDARAELFRHPALNLDPLFACIPSVAACRERDQQWVFGVDACDLVEGNGIQVFRDWKRELFPAPGGLFTGRMPKNAREVTCRFFHWLRNELLRETLAALEEAGGGEKPAVRICVPDHAAGSGRGRELTQLAREAGWEGGPVDLAVSEPVTNILGVLTGGVNRVARDEIGVYPEWRAMFEGSGLLRSIRQQVSDALVRPDLPDRHGILVVDVGAYTTDFALAEFALDQPRLEPRLLTASETLGVRMLDELVLKEIARNKAALLMKFSARELEAFRRRVYSEQAPYVAPGELVIGEGWEMRAVQGCIGRFAEEIWSALQGFLDRHRVYQVREAILTGGGNHIPGIALSLGEKLTLRGASVLHLPVAAASPTAECLAMAPDVVRGGSALGGVSIAGTF